MWGYMNKLLYTYLGLLLIHPQVFGLIGRVDILQHPKNQPVVFLGDAHYDDSRSYKQQHRIIEAASASHAHLICEDSGWKKHQVLAGLNKWAEWAGCNSVNVEFRTGDYACAGNFDKIPAREWAEKCLNQIDAIRSFDDEYNTAYKQFLESFDNSGCQRLIEEVGAYGNIPVGDAIISVVQNNEPVAKKIFDGKYEMEKEIIVIKFLNLSGLHVALDMTILHQIALSNRKKLVPIVAAGVYHTENLSNILQTYGYNSGQFYHDKSLMQCINSGIKINNDETAYRTFFNPVQIPKLKNAPQKTSWRSRVVLPFMHARGTLEDSAFGRWKYRNQAFFNIPGVRPGLKFLAAGISAVGCYLASKFSS